MSDTRFFVEISIFSDMIANTYYISLVINLIMGVAVLVSPKTKIVKVKFSGKIK